MVQIHPNRLLGVVGEHDFPIEAMDLSHDLSLLASSSHDNCIRFWNVDHIYNEDNDDEDEIEKGEENGLSDLMVRGEKDEMIEDEYYSDEEMSDDMSDEFEDECNDGDNDHNMGKRESKKEEEESATPNAAVGRRKFFNDL